MPPEAPLIWGAWLCLVSPLAAAALIALGGNRLSRRGAGYLATLATFVAFVGAAISFFSLVGRDPGDRSHLSTAWTWLEAGSYHSGFSVLVDPLSVMMMLIVSGVGALIVGYSIGYMDGDAEERRYFAYMALFVFSMLLLVEIIVVVGLKAGGRLSHQAHVTRAFGSPAAIGRLFLTDHLLAFEITSIVLLVAAVGGVVLGAHARRGVEWGSATRLPTEPAP